MTSVIGNGRRRMGLSPLSRRLSAVAQAVSEEWTLLAENIPMWPELPLPPINLICGDGHYGYAPSQGGLFRGPRCYADFIFLNGMPLQKDGLLTKGLSYHT